jgi:hypothetical protein
MPRSLVPAVAALVALSALAACAPQAAPPTVGPTDGGQIVVSYPNGCRMYYSQTGSLLESGNRCSYEQRRYAEEEFRTYIGAHPPQA